MFNLGFHLELISGLYKNEAKDTQDDSEQEHKEGTQEDSWRAHKSTQSKHTKDESKQAHKRGHTKESTQLGLTENTQRRSQQRKHTWDSWHAHKGVHIKWNFSYIYCYLTRFTSIV